MKVRNAMALVAVAALACAFLLTSDVSLAHVATACLAVPAASLNSAHLLSREMSNSTAIAGVPRAVQFARPRADGSDPKALISAVQTAVTELRTSLEDKLKSKVDDAVLNEKIGRIDASVSNFQSAIDELNAKLATANLGGSVIGDIPGDPEYIEAFKAHMRKGTIDASMTKGTAEDGGYLAPIEWDRTITDKLKVISPIRANSRVITITGAGFKKMYNDRAVGSGWVGETASRPATSTPTLGQLDFVPGEIYANPAISQQLLDDAAINLEQWLRDEVDTEFSRQEGIAFASGDGVNKPFGILTYVTGAANAAKHPWGAISVINSGHASQFTADGFIDLFYGLPAEFRTNAKLYTNRLSQSAMRKLKDGNGNYLWQPSFAAGQPATLGGEPIVEIADFPNVAANAVVALYGDMAATYLVVDRVGIRVLRDPYTNKPFVHFYTTKRVGGGVFNPEPMRALKVAA